MIVCLLGMSEVYKEEKIIEFKKKMDFECWVKCEIIGISMFKKLMCCMGVMVNVVINIILNFESIEIV